MFLEFKGREESLVRQCVDLLRKEKRLHNIAWGHFEDDGVNALLTRGMRTLNCLAVRTDRSMWLPFAARPLCV